MDMQKKKAEFFKKFTVRFPKELKGKYLNGSPDEAWQFIEQLLAEKDKEFETILETMPTGTTRMLKIAESEFALEQLHKTQPELTMRDLEEHNIEAKGHDEGFKKAVEEFKKWRNEIYLKFKKLV